MRVLLQRTDTIHVSAQSTAATAPTAFGNGPLPTDSHYPRMPSSFLGLSAILVLGAASASELVVNVCGPADGLLL